VICRTARTHVKPSIHSVLAGLLAVLATACAASPPGPRGPLGGPGVELAYDMSFAYGRGEANLPDGAVARGNADFFWSPATGARRHWWRGLWR
jgi:hypothetical protein